MFKLPDLPYDYSALEPHIDARTMEIHHSKHHQGYVDKLNAAVEGTEHAERDLEDLLQNISSLPEDIRIAVRNNGGGHYNHSLFWTVMSPDGGGEPSGELADAIDSAFGGLSEFKEKFSSTAASQFGSGWGWLVVANSQGQIASGKSLKILSTPNQDSPIFEGNIPILGVDVWEHAYYLNYQNKRGDYLDAWWNIVSWEEVGRRYREAM